MADFSFHVYSQGDEKLLAICDNAILDQKLDEETDFQVGDFYKGEICQEERAKQLITEATIVNAVGKDIISLMLKEKFIDLKSVKDIKGVPHAQIISL